MEELFGQGDVALMDYLKDLHAKVYGLDGKIGILIEIQKALILNKDISESELYAIIDQKAEKMEKEFYEFLVKHVK